MLEWAKFSKEFIQDVGFPIAVAIALLYGVFWVTRGCGNFFAPKFDAMFSAVVGFLKTTGASIAKQTEILLVIAGVQREQGHALNQLLSRQNERLHCDRLHQEELENDDCGRCPSAVGDPVSTVHRL